MRVTFLTPRLPPAVCGVADHTRLLAEALRAEGAAVGFVHAVRHARADPLPGPVDHWTGGTDALAACLARQGADWLWVQLSNYGYSRWGTPYGLARVLGRLRHRLPGLRLAVYLHETHCLPRQLGRKGCLLSPLQRHAVGAVARLGDVVFAAVDLYRHRAVHDYGVPAAKVAALPIGSNIPAAGLSPEGRADLRRRLGWRGGERVAVTFGAWASQLRALRRFEPLLAEGLARGELHRVVCLGGDGPDVPAELAGWAARFARPGCFDVLGPRPAAEVGAILACGDFAFAAIHRTALAKSGTFLAYAFAGLAVLTYPTDLYGDFPAEPMPVLAAESWDWREAGSARVADVRRALRRLAETSYRWDGIARAALARLRAQQAGPVPAPATAPTGRTAVAALALGEEPS